MPSSRSPAACSTSPTSIPRSGSSLRCRGAASVSLMLTVADVDARIAAATRAGGQRDREPYEAYGHRNAWSSTRSSIAGCCRRRCPPRLRRTGTATSATSPSWVPDVDRAAAFYARCSAGPTRRSTAAEPAASSGDAVDRHRRRAGARHAVLLLRRRRRRRRGRRRCGPRAGRRTSRPRSRTAAPRCASTTRAPQFAVYRGRPDASGERPPVERRRPGDLATSLSRSWTPRGPAPSTAPCSAGGSARPGARTGGVSKTSSR